MILKTKNSGKKEEEKIPIPSQLPILPLRDAVLFPKMILPLMITQERSLRLIDDALVKDKLIGVCALKDPEAKDPRTEDIHLLGTAATILKMFKMPDGTLRLIAQGLSRIKIVRYLRRRPYYQAQIESIPEKTTTDMEIEAMILNVRGIFKKIIDISPHLPEELGIIALNIDDPSTLSDLITFNLNISTPEKQEVLETIDVKKRLEKVLRLLNKNLQVLELGSKIQSQITGEIGKTQREYYLREQLKAIQKELGEKDERTLEIEEFRKKIEAAGMPEQARREAERELDRLSHMPPAAAEYTVARTYLEWLVELPWSRSTEDKLDIGESQRILDEDHYNLEKVKKRIVEYLAVRKLKEDMKGPILCFVGPPGTGKTSLGRSIARALGRNFYRLSLGGVRDEAEIRGHRRTYVGALPGRIIQGIRRAGSHNPVFMIDEVDKIGTDFRGDPSSALLEVLDPEQNFSFSDHYLDVDFDLSRVMFITTANILDPIPPALRDRLEVLELPGYTQEEKLMIAHRFLIPKQLKEHGLESNQLEFTDQAIARIITDYTREAGLRNLEREIASICRGVAKEVAEGGKEQVIIEPQMLSRFLGPIKFFSEVAERTSQTGVATGMAWTQTGGDIIFVEATRMMGKKTLNLTGQLGEVMKESAQAALSYLRSRSLALGIPEDFFENSDIHIHIPAGAIPKDGPSAGLTIFTALISLLTNRPVRSDVAMTGEITLRGLVLPVGGIKEKCLAARRAGITTVILPKKNEKDLEDIPPSVREGLNFAFVERMEEALPLALTDRKG